MSTCDEMKKVTFPLRFSVLTVHEEARACNTCPTASTLKYTGRQSVKIHQSRKEIPQNLTSQLQLSQSELHRQNMWICKRACIVPTAAQDFKWASAANHQDGKSLQQTEWVGALRLHPLQSESVFTCTQVSQVIVFLWRTSATCCSCKHLVQAEYPSNV